MRRYIWIAILLGIIAAGGVLVVLALDEPELELFEANVISSDLEVPSVGFTQVAGDYEWEFPRDFGPHPDFQREQWEIQSADGCEVEFSILFDRASFVPEIFAPDRESAWAMDSIVAGRLTINDVESELSSRVAIDLAGADENRVWLEDWEFDWVEGTLVVSGESGDLNLMLTFGEPENAGVDGEWYAYSRVGEASGNITAREASSEITCPVNMTHRFQ